MKLQRVAAAMPFAQLLGLAKRAEDDEDSKRGRRAEEEDGDDKDEKVGRAEDDERDDEASSARADEEDGDGDEEEAEEEDSEEGDDKDGKKSRKAKSKRAEDEEEEDGGDDGDEEGRKAKSARGAIRRERARCAKIIAHGVAVGSVRQACVLAFDTGMGVKAAIASLNACKADTASAAAPRAGLHERMAAAGVPNVGAGSEGGAPPTMTKVAAAIIAAGEKARGETSRK